MADQTITDPQEIKEREEAAKAYSEEDEKEFVDFVDDFVTTSRDARKDVLEIQKECWKAYQNKMDFPDKQDWQSKVVLPKPFASVERACSIIRKAFKNPEYVTVDGVSADDVDWADGWKRSLRFWNNEQHANFPKNFTNANRMAFAVGNSMEIVPSWSQTEGLLSTLSPRGRSTETPTLRAGSRGRAWVGVMRSG
jgi:hypothetical protein